MRHKQGVTHEMSPQTASPVPLIQLNALNPENRACESGEIKGDGIPRFSYGIIKWPFMATWYILLTL